MQTIVKDAGSDDDTHTWWSLSEVDLPCSLGWCRGRQIPVQKLKNSTCLKNRACGSLMSLGIKWCAVLHDNRKGTVKSSCKHELTVFLRDPMGTNPVSVVLCCKKCLSHADHTRDKTDCERGRRANRLHSTSGKPRCAFSLTKLRRSRWASRHAEAKSGLAQTGDKNQREPTDRCRSKSDKTPVAHPTCTISARNAEIGQQHQICFVVRHQISTVLPE